MRSGNPLPGWHSPEQAWAQTQGQLAWYRAIEEKGEMTQITDAAGLEKHLAVWQKRVDQEMRARTESDEKRAAGHELSAGFPLNPTHAPIGYILNLEGADSVLTPARLEQAYAQGLRAVGPAHYGR